MNGTRRLTPTERAILAEAQKIRKRIQESRYGSTYALSKDDNYEEWERRDRQTDRSRFDDEYWDSDEDDDDAYDKWRDRQSW